MYARLKLKRRFFPKTALLRTEKMVNVQYHYEFQLFATPTVFLRCFNEKIIIALTSIKLLSVILIVRLLRN